MILQNMEATATGIERINTRLDRMRDDDIAKMRTEIAVLQFKSGVWGFMAGAIPAVVIAVYWFTHHGP